MEAPLAADLLARAARRWPDKVAVRAAADTWTFADLDYAAAEIAGRVAPGDRVAFRAEMTIAAIAASWGIPRGGGVAVPIEPQLDVAAAAAAARALGATLGFPAPPPGPWSEAEPDPQQPALIVATSGTTGEPRGVLITAGNVAAAAAASSVHLGTRPTDRWLLVMPLHHVAGLAILWRAAHDGSEVVLHDGFAPEAVAAALSSGVSWVSLVPTMLRRLLDAARGPWPDVRGALIGGARAAGGLIAEAQTRGLAALATYGMTETCGQAATVRPGSGPAAAGTVGHPLPGVALTVDAPPGRAGLILVDGPTVAPGYTNEPPRAGPLITNDIGRFDGNGRLVVLGRADDVIVTGGENVHPAVVEDALAALPGVEAAVAFGVPDPEWGERVVAVVQGRDVASAGLRAALDERLPRHAIPKEIRVVVDLPLLGAGKVDRAAVRARYAG